MFKSISTQFVISSMENILGMRNLFLFMVAFSIAFTGAKESGKKYAYVVVVNKPFVVGAQVLGR